MNRNNLSEDEANTRINSQLSFYKKYQVVNVVIDNSFDIDYLNRQIDKLIKFYE
jgi:dephospho-CoA kinase